MIKPLGQKGLAISHIASITQAPDKNQQFRFIELSNYIHRRELTNALEILAQSKIEGEAALFALACLQSLEVTA